MSRGAAQLYNLLKEYFPGKTIIKEYTFSNGLRLDFYIPELNVGVEFDGQQHFAYNDHFYKTKSDFYLAQNRDEQKEYICQQLGINLIRFSDEKKLDLEVIDKRYTGPGSGEVQEGAEKYIPKSVLAKAKNKEYNRIKYQEFKNSKYHKKQRKEAKEWRKEQYRRFVKNVE